MIHVEGESLGHRMAEPLTALLQEMAGPYEHIVFPGTTSGKNVAPRLAALLDVMVISEITGVVAPDTFERPIYAGNAIQTVQSADAKKVVTVRGASFEATGEQAPGPIETAGGGADPGTSAWVEDKVAASDRPELDLGQDRGLRRPRRRLGGELRASSRSWPTSSAPPSAPRAPRSTPAIAPNDWQVGQTGKVVAPGSLHRRRHLRARSSTSPG